MRNFYLKNSVLPKIVIPIEFISLISIYSCIDGNKYILTLHQETPIRLPGCPTNTKLCKLDIIERLYKDSLENCDYDSLCSVKSAVKSDVKSADNGGYWSSLIDYIWDSLDSLRKLYL